LHDNPVYDRQALADRALFHLNRTWIPREFHMVQALWRKPVFSQGSHVLVDNFTHGI